jgi:hypothetical protein
MTRASTKGSGFDVLNVTFIYTSRWIGAGWLTPLDPASRTPPRRPPTGATPISCRVGAADE